VPADANANNPAAPSDGEVQGLIAQRDVAQQGDLTEVVAEIDQQLAECGYT
jgi:hypothetical protein